MTTDSVHLIPALSDNYIYGLEWADGCAVIDPAEATPVEKWLASVGKPLTAILITHHHADHIGGNSTLKQKWGCPIFAPQDPRIEDIERALHEGEAIQIGPYNFQVIATPGHTTTHISLYCPVHKILFAGDTLFMGGCGRLFEGTAEDMYASMQKLAQLPGDTQVYCGHEYTLSNLRFAVEYDPDNTALQERYANVQALRRRDEPTIPATLAEELATNPFIRASSAEELGRIRALKDAF